MLDHINSFHTNKLSQLKRMREGEGALNTNKLSQLNRMREGEGGSTEH